MRAIDIATTSMRVNVNPGKAEGSEGARRLLMRMTNHTDAIARLVTAAYMEGRADGAMVAQEVMSDDAKAIVLRDAQRYASKAQREMHLLLRESAEKESEG